MADNNEHLTGLEIAVTGMALRFPGASSIQEFWENLEQGVESISFFTEEEGRAAGASEQMLQDPNYVNAKGIVEHIEWFDPGVFDYTPAEATVLDPQLRLFHECCWEALEDAGVNSATFKGKIGLFAGASNNFYWQALAYSAASSQILDPFSIYQLVNKDAVAALVSFKLNLRGPGYSVNTACSTSLVTVHLAAQALLSGECRLALAGGTTVMLPQKQGYVYKEGMVSSPDGHCRAFDKEARGTVGGDGAGVVLLKMYEDALEDRDHVYALIKGSATNNDGSRKSGYTAPSIQGQVGVIRAAQAFAEVEPDTIGLIEAHGTGTPIGDPIEMEALKKAFGSERKNICAVGSVKTNMGHLDAAAGIAGLIKAILSLYHKKIPPSLHFNQPNPRLEIEDSPFYINTTSKSWLESDNPRRAGVSSFGVGGTNAHVVLEEAPALPPQSGSPSRPYQLLLLSANSEDSLERKTEELAAHMAGDPAIDLADVAYTLQTGRKEFPLRRMAVCSSTEEAADPAIFSRVQRGPRHKPPVIFLFAGIGSQYVGMGRELYADEHLFRQDMDRCFAVYTQLTGGNLKEVLYPEAVEGENLDGQRIDSFQLAQPALFAVEYALARLLMAWGIEPQSMMGYSFGEYVAACVAGSLTLEDAMRLLVLRGEAAAKIAGGMLSVPLEATAVEPYLDGDLYLAIDNGDSCVIAGSAERLEELEGRLKQDKLFCVKVQNPCPLHSPLMKPAADELGARIADLRLEAPAIPYISNVSGDWMIVADAQDPSYYTRHLTGPVRFADGMGNIFDDPAAILVEIGPGRDLATMLGRFLESKGSSPRQMVNVLRPAHQKKHDQEYLLQNIGRLWLRGAVIDWDSFYGEEQRRRVPLPTYPFDRKRYWIDGNPFQAGMNGSGAVEISMPDETEHTIAVEDSALDSNTLYVEAENPIQRQLLAMWRRFFGVDTIGIRDDFFQLGGDSLKAMNVAALIQKEMGVEIPLGEFYNRHTVENLSLYVQEVQDSGGLPSLEPAEHQEYYPLSSAQRRLYALQQMAEDTTGYNEPIAVSITGELDIEKVEGAFVALIRRHEVLRTRFILREGEPAQQVLEAGDITFSLQFQELPASALKPEALIKEFIRPFDLAEAPILRVKVVELEAHRHILLVDTHHIISDGTTQTILMKEFASLYSGVNLEPLPVQYKDFAQWQHCLLLDGVLKKQEEYWLDVFAQQPPELELPYDRPRPAILGFRGTTFHFSLDAEVARQLKELAAKAEASLFMALLAVFNVLLARLSGEEDIVVGSPIAGRRLAELQPLMGMFVNTLAHRNRPQGDKTFWEFLKEVKANTIAAFDHQDIQFETLVQQVAANRNTGRNPLFDIMFTLQNIQMPEMELRGLKIQPLIPDTGSTKFDLSLLGFQRQEGVDFTVEYNTDLFDPSTIQRFMDYFKHLLEEIIAEPGSRISDLELLSSGEKIRLLESLTGETTELEEEATFMEDWQKQVELGPDRIALVHPAGNRQVTHGFSRERALGWARYLTDRGAGPGRIVSIMAEPTLDVMLGLLAILASGAAFLPIDRDYPRERIDTMLRDSGSVFLLDGEQGDILSEDSDPVRCSPDDPAYCIYTSGSTGQPKGVLISHRNLANFCRWHNSRFGLTHRDRGAKYAGFSFDASILEIFPFLAAGASIFLVQKEDRLDLQLVDDIFHKHCITVAYLPTALCRSYMELENRGLRLLHTGGEKLTAFSPGDYPLADNYGPSECTVVTSCNVMDQTNTRLSLGRVVDNTTICVLDRYDRLQPPGVPGELCVAGECVGMGYLNRPELTARAFTSHPLLPGKRMYRTGDIVRLTAGGALEFLGRKDQQVKIRGFRIELGEIENLLTAHPALEAGVVAALDHRDGSKFLCAYMVPSTAIDSEELKSYLAAKLPDYMVPSLFVELEALPLTNNGKIDRPRLPLPELNGGDGDECTAPENETQRQLCDIWKEVLDLESVGIRQNFFTIGGDSIKAIKLMSAVNRRFETHLKVMDLYHCETVEKLASRLAEDSVGGQAVDLAVVEEEIQRLKEKIVLSLDPQIAATVEDIYPMSDIQKGMVFHSLKDQSIAAYHNQFPVTVTYEDFCLATFTSAVKLMMEKHSILRTAFAVDHQDEPAQLVFETVAPDIDYQDIAAMDHEAQYRHIAAFMETDRQHPFSLDRPPLFRLRLFALGGDKICILLILHHAILDGWSNATLMTELNNTYRRLKKEPAFVPPPLQATYRDCVIHELAEKRNPAAREFWLRELEDYRRLELPRADAVDDGQPTMAMIKVPLGKELSAKLPAAATFYDTPVKNLCLAAYLFMLNMITYETDLTVGLVGHTRPMVEESDLLLGCFLNTVPLRLQIPAGIRWLDFVELVKQKALAIKAHDSIPFFEIVKIIGEKSLDSNPVFDTIFNYIDFHVLHQAESAAEASETSNEKTPAIEEYGHTNTLIDLSVNAYGEEIGLSLNIHRRVMEEEGGRRLCSYFKRVLELLIDQPAKLASTADVLAEDERSLLEEWWSRDDSSLPASASVVEAMDEARQRFPGRVALVFQHHHITYDTFWNQSGALAGVLVHKGIGPGRLAAVNMERSPWMIIAIVGILRAGAAYLPIDPDYPQTRIRYMLEDSGASCLVSQKEVEEAASAGAVTDSLPLPSGHDAAYVIYTSGSTGKPKGVLVEHGSVVNLVASQTKAFGIDETERILQFSTICFDASVEQIFLALCNGAASVLIARDDILDHLRFGAYALRQQVTHVHTVPSYLNHIDPAPLRGLRRAIAGGDVCPPELAKKWSSVATFFNEYGPTETTVTSIQLEIPSVENYWSQCPIGKPLDNTFIHVLDRNMEPVPPGIEGELYIGGAGVARGYLNRPQLTERMFVKDPRQSGQRLYRTGDLVRYVPDGNLEFRGRVDQQVKIRGFRIELGEIENQILQCEGVKEAVVTARRDDAGELYLAAYVVPASNEPDSFDRQTVKSRLADQLPVYMIPSSFTPLADIPHTPSGKRDVAALPEPDTAGSGPGIDFQAPLDRVEEILIQVAREILGQPVIGMGDNFFDLGGDSIKAIQLSAALLKHRLKLEVKDLFLDPVFATIAACVTPMDRDIPQNPVSGAAVLTPIQHDLFRHVGDRPHHFNQAVMLFHKEGFDEDLLREAFSRVVEHHDALRMVFPLKEGIPSPFNRPPGEGVFQLKTFDYARESNAEESIAQKVEEIQGGLDIEAGPLVRLAIFKTGTGDHLLMVIHHLLVDGVSWRVLFEDLATSIRQITAAEPVSLPLKTDSFLHWCQCLAEYAGSQQLAAEIPYWQEVEAGGEGLLLVDEDRRAVSPLKSGVHADAVTGELLTVEETAELLTEVNRAFNTDINDILLTALSITLNRWTGKGRHAIVLEGHGREDILEDITISRTVGWFTSQYPVILQSPPEMDVAASIKQTKEMLRQVPNKGIGYGLLKYLTPLEKRGAIGNHGEPDICFNFLGEFGQAIDGDQQVFGFSPLPVGTTVDPALPMRFSLDINGMVVNRILSFTFTFNRNEYSPPEIQRLFDYYRDALREIIGFCLGREETEHTVSDFTMSNMDEEELDSVYDALDEVMND
jgi:amino acid adenylation domain-containing protein/non-ribosomal peptide synthase protein (TIGR01720 family)